METFENIPNCYSVVNKIIKRTKAQNIWRNELGKTRVMLTSSKVQKIIYLCKLFWLVNHDECKMIPEDFAAWPHGPDIPQIYDNWMVYQDGDMCTCPNAKYELNEEEKLLINIMVDNTIDIPTWKLKDYICDSSGLWDYAYHREDKVISKDEMKQYIRNENNLRDLIEFLKKENSCHEKSKFLK